jgi:hypothetical protein
MVGLPAVAAPRALIACLMLDSLAHRLRKRNQASGRCLALNFGSDLPRAGAKSCKALRRPHPKTKAWVEINEFLINSVTQ